MVFLLALLLFTDSGVAKDSFGYENSSENDFNVTKNNENVTYGECSETIYGTAGFKQFHTNFEGGKNICVNITNFRFFLVWENYPLDTEVIYYQSLPGDKTPVEKKRYYAPDLPLFHESLIPFASFTICLPQGGYIAFSYGSSPNMCRTGWKISNALTYRGDFSENSEGFEKLGYYEDKCLLFVSRSSVNITIRSNFNGSTQRIIVYQDIQEPKSVYNYKETFANFDTTLHPLLVRIISHEKGSSLSVSMSSGAIHPTLEGTEEFKTRYTERCPKPVVCNLWSFIQPDLFFIYLTFSIIVLLIIIATVYVIVAWKYPALIGAQEKAPGLESAPFASTGALLEARKEPVGYFAMDQFRAQKE